MSNHKKVLVVQKDKHISKIISQCFSTKYSLVFQYDINKVFNLLETTHFDLVILDTHNETGNTLEIARRVKMESEAKVIFISSHIDIKIKEICFENGADDFLTKPFFPRELLIRSRKLLKEYENKFNYVIEKRGIQLYLQTRILKINKCTVYLSPTEFILFEYLIREDRFHKKEGLLNLLKSRKNKEMTETNVIVLINRLRQKLEKGTGMEIIKNRYGLGYYIGL